jgi:hypothetical protein
MLQPVSLDDVPEAVERMTDPDRLLEGEDPETADPEEAERWVRTYAELLHFKHEVVGHAEASAEDLPGRAKPEAEADLTLLRSERERLDRRYKFWRKRAAELRRG